jgi:GNAT superfamily N-acetyltransferase
MKIRQSAWGDPDAVALRAAQRAEIAAIYGTPDSDPGVPPSAVDVAVFFVAYGDDGTAVGCAGLRDLGEGVGEIKRMYVAPAGRGSGIAALVLRSLEDWARGQGWRSLRLETGDRLSSAMRFYTRSGYERITNFGAYADSESSVCFERLL